jgi:archaetidylinositol phosphate synthase
MSESLPAPGVRAARRPWDARLARRLVRGLQHSPVTPNHLTTVRLAVGIAAAGALMQGGYGWMNLGALLFVVSNFLDHTDGELARLTGKTSRLGHWYDLASDALITVLLFIAIGIGIKADASGSAFAPQLGAIAGIAVALIFYLRMRIEEQAGKAGSEQAMLGGFQTEDVLYLLPLITLCDGAARFLLTAAVGAPLYLIWVLFDYRRVVRSAP